MQPFPAAREVESIPSPRQHRTVMMNPIVTPLLAVPRTGALQMSHGQVVLGGDSVVGAQEKWDLTGMLRGVSLCCSIQLIWYCW